MFLLDDFSLFAWLLAIIFVYLCSKSKPKIKSEEWTDEQWRKSAEEMVMIRKKNLEEWEKIKAKVDAEVAAMKKEQEIKERLLKAQQEKDKEKERC